MSQHIVPIKTYVATFLALMVLLVFAVLAVWIENPTANFLAGMLIAVAKATLIVLYFMHVRYATPLVRVVVVTSLLGLAVLLVLIGSDVVTRNWPNTSNAEVSS